MQGNDWWVRWLILLSTWVQSVVVSVCQAECLPDLIDDFIAVSPSERLHASLILRSQSAPRLQHSLSTASGLGAEQGLHLARVRTGALRPPGTTKEPERWGSKETLWRARLEWVLALTDHHNQTVMLVLLYSVKRGLFIFACLDTVITVFLHTTGIKSFICFVWCWHEVTACFTSDFCSVLRNFSL